MRFVGGTFTINGNGHKIIGPTNALALQVAGSSTVLNLNDVTIQQAGASGNVAVSIESGATLNAQDITFSNNANRTTVSVNNGRANFTNLQFLNSTAASSDATYGSAMTIFASSTVSINNGIFEGNSGQNSVITVTSSTLQLNGCLTFMGNTRSGGAAADNIGERTGATVTDNSDCPKPKRKEKVPTATPTPRPQAVTCPALAETIGVAVRATYGMRSGVQCQRLDGGGIGIQSIVDAGFIEAVDIWGYVEQGVEVCFPQAGALLFLDARTAPRAIVPLESTIVSGMTCGAISTPGSIVLVPAPSQ